MNQSCCSTSDSNGCFLTCLQDFQEAGKVVWYSHLLNFPLFVVIYTVRGFSIVNEAEVDVFQEFPCFLYDPMNDGNLTSGSSAFSKSSLYIWNFSVHVLLKPSYKQSNLYADFSHIYTPLRLQLSSLSLVLPNPLPRLAFGHINMCWCLPSLKTHKETKTSLDSPCL